MAEDSESSTQGVLCILCKTDDENVTTGPLLSKDGISAHENCLVYSSGIYCKNSPSFDDLCGFDVEDVKNEYSRGQKLKCYYCRNRGATVGCEEKKCKRSYHYPCAILDHARCVKKKSKGLFMLYCPKHEPKRSKNSDLANEPHGVDAGINFNINKRWKLDNCHEESSSGQKVRGRRQRAPRTGTPVRKSSRTGLSKVNIRQPLSQSDSVAAPSRITIKKRVYEIISSASDTEVTPCKKKKPVSRMLLQRAEADCCDTDQMIVPLDESDIEEILPEIQQRQSTPIPEDKRNKNREKPISSPPEATLLSADGDETDIEETQTDPEQATAESQSLLESEYRHDSVPFTVISDSGPFSVDSENSIGTTSPSLLPGQAAASLMDRSHGSLSAPEQATTVHTPTITTSVINIPEPDCPFVDSPPQGGASAAEPVEVPHHASPTAPSCEESDYNEQCEQPARPASRNTVPLNLSHDLPESHAPPTDWPLNRAASPGCSTASPQHTEVVQEESVYKTGAALFWRRCNEVGCTDAIFSELTNQISSLSGRVQSQHATQQDYAISLRILEASGKLPAIFQQLEQDFEERERELKRKREALKEARDLLKNHPN